MTPKPPTDPAQPELPMDDSKKQPAETTSPVEGKPTKEKPAATNGGAHIVAEATPEIAHRTFAPEKIELPLHRRVDKGFLEYASYVIRDRAIPNLEDGLKPVQRRIL